MDIKTGKKSVFLDAVNRINEINIDEFLKPIFVKGMICLDKFFTAENLHDSFFIEEYFEKHIFNKNFPAYDKLEIKYVPEKYYATNLGYKDAPMGLFRIDTVKRTHSIYLTHLDPQMVLSGAYTEEEAINTLVPTLVHEFNHMLTLYKTAKYIDANNEIVETLPMTEQSSQLKKIQQMYESKTNPYVKSNLAEIYNMKGLESLFEQTQFFEPITEIMTVKATHEYGTSGSYLELMYPLSMFHKIYDIDITKSFYQRNLLEYNKAPFHITMTLINTMKTVHNILHKGVDYRPFLKNNKGFLDDRQYTQEEIDSFTPEQVDEINKIDLENRIYVCLELVRTLTHDMLVNYAKQIFESKEKPDIKQFIEKLVKVYNTIPARYYYNYEYALNEVMDVFIGKYFKENNIKMSNSRLEEFTTLTSNLLDDVENRELGFLPDVKESYKVETNEYGFKIEYNDNFFVIYDLGIINNAMHHSNGLLFNIDQFDDFELYNGQSSTMYNFQTYKRDRVVKKPGQPIVIGSTPESQVVISLNENREIVIDGKVISKFIYKSAPAGKTVEEVYFESFNNFVKRAKIIDTKLEAKRNKATGEAEDLEQDLERSL